jgi:predicted DCC family thiol-disulfide oxidoreductase YuxK
MLQSNVILFDGVCNLCCGWVQFLIRKDKHFRFKFASLQSESGKKLSDALELNTNQLETVIYIKDNQHYTESEAILQIVKELGGIWKLLLIFRLIPKSIRNNIYRFIARKRYTIFGKRSSCMIPTPNLQKRFLT